MKFPIAALIILFASPAPAQHQQHQQHGQSPYASQQQRSIKALSEQQIADLRDGRGMSLALPAELNGYPGPLHVLELADRLQLTLDQRQRVRHLYEAMKAEAILAGETLIEQERLLDQHFADRKVTPASLTSLTAQIGQTQAALRATHLKYHLTTADLLTPAQMRTYAEQRGYR